MKAFTTSLERGVKYFGEILAEVEDSGAAGAAPAISGERAFYLYDTLGFPIDLTQLMAAEKGLTVDVPGFLAAMNEQVCARDQERINRFLSR